MSYRYLIEAWNDQGETDQQAKPRTSSECYLLAWMSSSFVVHTAGKEIKGFRSHSFNAKWVDRRGQVP